MNEIDEKLFEEMKTHLILVRVFLIELIHQYEKSDMPKSADYTRQRLTAIETTLKKLHYDYIRNA